jgi:hypothetical protein
MSTEMLRFELKKRGLKTPRERIGKEEERDEKGKKRRIGLTDHKQTLLNWINGEKSRQDMADRMMKARITSRIRQFREAKGCTGTLLTESVFVWNPYDYLEMRRNSTPEDNYFHRANHLLNKVSKSFDNCSGQQVESMIKGYEQIAGTMQPKYARYERELEDHDDIIVRLSRRTIQFPKSGMSYFYLVSSPDSNVCNASFSE